MRRLCLSSKWVLSKTLIKIWTHLSTKLLHVPTPDWLGAIFLDSDVDRLKRQRLQKKRTLRTRCACVIEKENLKNSMCVCQKKRTLRTRCACAIEKGNLKNSMCVCACVFLLSSVLYVPTASMALIDHCNDMGKKAFAVANTTLLPPGQIVS